MVGHPADPQAGCSALLWPPRHDPVRDGRASAGSRPAGRSTPDPPSAALRVVSPGQPACHRCACGPVFAGERASALARAARLRPASTAAPVAPPPQEAAQGPDRRPCCDGINGSDEAMAEKIRPMSAMIWSMLGPFPFSASTPRSRGCGRDWAQPCKPALPSSSAKNITTRTTLAGRLPRTICPKGREAGPGSSRRRACP